MSGVDWVAIAVVLASEEIMKQIFTIIHVTVWNHVPQTSIERI